MGRILARSASMLLLAVALAGCGEERGLIQYHGGEPGLESVTILCEEGARTLSVDVTHRGDAGKKFRVTALTPINKERAIDEIITMRGPGDLSETYSTPAIQGAWQLEVERLDPFQGNIEVRGRCG